MSEVAVVVKVVDKMTAESQAIFGKFKTTISGVADATKKWLGTFDARAMAAPIKGIQMAVRAVEQYGAVLNRLAPDAKKFTATFSKDEQAKITQAAEGYNKLAAAVDTVLGRMASATNAGEAFDAWAGKIKMIGYEADQVLSPLAKLEIELAKAQEALDKGPASGGQEGSAQARSYRYLAANVELATKAISDFLAMQDRVASNSAKSRAKKDADDEGRIRQRNAASGATLLGGDDQGPEMWPTSLREIRAIQDASAAAMAAFGEQTRAELMELADDRVKATADAIDEMQSLEEDWGDVWTRMVGDYYDEQERLNAEKNAAIIEQEEFADAFADAQLKKHVDDLRAASVKMREVIEESNRKAQEFAREAAGMMTGNVMTFFDALITGSENAGRAFTRMIAGMISDFGRMMTQRALMSLFSGLFAPAASGESSDLNTHFGGNEELFNLYGTSYDTGGHASGGNVRGGMPIMVGERGPELFVPNQSGNVMTSGRSGGGGGIGSVVINVNGAQDPSRTAREVKSALSSLMANDPSARQMMRRAIA